MEVYHPTYSWHHQETEEPGLLAIIGTKARASPLADPSALRCNLCRSCLFNKVNALLAMPSSPGSYLGHTYGMCNFMKNICLLKQPAVLMARLSIDFV